MTRLIKKRMKKPGAPPGTLVYSGDALEKATQITMFLYDDEKVDELHPRNIEEAFAALNNEQKTWIHFNGVSDAHLISAIGSRFDLHPLMLEDIMNPNQRSKLDDYKNYIYIVTHILHFNNSQEKTVLEEEQISIVVGEKILLSFTDKDSEVLRPIRERMLRQASKMHVRGVDYLAYAIIDCIVDYYFLILEKFDNSLEALENELFHDPKPETLEHIQKSKRELALLRKTIWPMREVVNQFRRIDSPLIAESTRVYTYDVYDHTIQAIETIEGFRDITSGMLDVYLSTMSQHMNEIMKVLTVMATIFVPLTFITSLYGMNFEHMPELHAAWGYPAVLMLMLSITFMMLWYFHKRRWI